MNHEDNSCTWFFKIFQIHEIWLNVKLIFSTKIVIYIYFEDLERALKFIFLRKYINQSFWESLWKFTDFLPCGKSYFSKANLCSPNLDKGVPSLAHRPFILRFERNSAVMLYFYTWQNCLCKTCARERSSSIFSTPNFAWKWLEYDMKGK